VQRVLRVTRIIVALTKGHHRRSIDIRGCIVGGSELVDDILVQEMQQQRDER